jgi:hypothetical protein
MGQKKIIKVLYSRKPADWNEIKYCLSLSHQYASPTFVAEIKDMSDCEYEDFIANPLVSRDWLNDKGGTINDIRQSIAITCAGRPTLYVDPSGYDYARYIGLEIPTINERQH